MLYYHSDKMKFDFYGSFIHRFTKHLLIQHYSRHSQVLENSRWKLTCTGRIVIQHEECYNDDGGGQGGIENTDQIVWCTHQQI